MYNQTLKYEWNSEKNEWLKKERNISFEQIIFHLLQGDLWKIADHPEQEKYPDQKIYFVLMDNYIYLVPYVKKDNQVFLKTIIPSRKATKDYQKELEK
ncbi:MAG: toxin [Candidatus Desantisbacteria bacterium]